MEMGKQTEKKPAIGGWAGWLVKRLRRARAGGRARLELLERIQLAPRQSRALVEADGRRFLVATSAEGAPAFLPIDGAGRIRGRAGASRVMRISW